MYDWNGTPPRRQLWRTLAAWRRCASRAWTRLAEQPPPARLACALMLLVLVTLCAGCATSSPPETWPSNPQAPRLSEPLPSESYSSQAQRLIESWLRAVTGM